MCPTCWSSSPACHQALLRPARALLLASLPSEMPTLHPGSPGKAFSAPHCLSQPATSTARFSVPSSSGPPLGSLAKPRNFSYDSLYFLCLS